MEASGWGLFTGKFPSLDLSSGSGCYGSILSQPPWVVLSETCLSEPVFPESPSLFYLEMHWSLQMV